MRGSCAFARWFVTKREGNAKKTKAAVFTPRPIKNDKL